MDDLTFLGSPRPRVALLAGDAHPLPTCERFYAGLDQLAAAHGFEWRAFHIAVADPRELPAASRRRLGDGVLVSADPAEHAQDAARFQAVAPQAFAAVVDELAAFLGEPAAVVAARADVLQAIGCARWIQAFAPRALVTIGQHHDSFRAAVVARLLALPSIAVLDDPDLGDPRANLMPLHLRGATAVVATNEAALQAATTRFGEALRGVDVFLGLDRMVDAFARAAARGRPDPAAPLGPRAAFGPLAPSPGTVDGVRRFALLGAERTGSNLLMGMLDAHAGMLCANELFNRREIDDGVVAWPPRIVADQSALAAERARSPADLLRRLAADAAAAGARCCGFKLMYGHALRDERVVEAVAGDPAFAVVHLLRRDRLQRWLSHARAVASDRWFGGERDDGACTELSPAATALDFAAHATMEARFRAAFAGNPTLELDYEDLVQRLPECGRRLGAFLGVDLGELRPRTHKTGPRDPGAAIANRDELRAAFAGTKWAGLFS